MRNQKKRSIRRWKSEKYSHATMLFVRAFFCLFAVGMLILFLSRLSLLFSQGDEVLQVSFSSELLRAFLMGVRFDAKMMATVALPFLLFPILYAFTEIHFPIKFVRVLWVLFSTLILVLLFVICVVDYYYFSFFHTHFDATALGFVEDDTTAVLQSIWRDFPVLRFALVLLLFTLISACVMYLMVRRPNRAKYPSYFVKRFSILVLLLAGSFILARGSFSALPLGSLHLRVSSHPFINQLANNAPFALYQVVAHARENRLEVNSEQTLREWGFSSAQEAIQTYIGKWCDAENPWKALIDSTACNDSLKKNPPHVVVLQMESMPSYYMEFQDGAFDLVGELKDELPKGYWFRNTLSGGAGTLASLEGMLFSSLKGSVGQSSYYRTVLPYSVARIFQKQGYTASYITGQRLGWRNMENFLLAQGFDRVEGEVELEAHVSRAPRGVWGVHDEAMFERVLQILVAAKQPQFVYAMSISHHSPYDVPETDFFHNMRVPDSVWQRVTLSKEVARKSFAAFRYQTDQLGKFLKTLNASTFADNTIVVFTGDHTLKQNMKNCNDPLRLYGVPIVFFVPKRLYESDTVDLQQYASHNDIFPTLYHLALSGAKYLRTGRNLFASRGENGSVALYNRNLLLTERYAIPLSLQSGEGINNANSTTIIPVPERRRYDSLLRYGRSYYASMESFLIEELLNRSLIEPLFEPIACQKVDSLSRTKE